METIDLFILSIAFRVLSVGLMAVGVLPLQLKQTRKANGLKFKKCLLLGLGVSWTVLIIAPIDAYVFLHTQAFPVQARLAVSLMLGSISSLLGALMFLLLYRSK